MKTTMIDAVRLVALVAILMLVASCKGDRAEAPQPGVPDDAVTRAQAALQPFKAELQSALMTALEEGPEAAIDVCRMRAPAIAETQSTGGIRVGRTSHKLRNPANTPAPWMQPLLAAYLDDPLLREPRAVRLDAETVGYVEPITVKPLCLTCHGTSIPSNVQALLDEHYPTDEAIGFEEGDFRGLFWVTVPVHDSNAGP